MATAQDVIDSARYDLVDYNDGVGLGIEYDDTELLLDLNRMIGLLDSELSALTSDLVRGADDTLVTTANLDYLDLSSLNSGLWNRIRRVWINGNTMCEQVQLSYMYYTRQYRRSLLEDEADIAVGNYLQTINQNTTDLTTLGAADNNAGTYWTCSTAGTLGDSDRVWRFSSGIPTIWALEDNKIIFDSVPGAVYQVLVYYDKKTADLSLTDSMPYSDRFNEFLRERLVVTAKGRKNEELKQSDSVFASMFRERAMREQIQRGFVRKAYNYWEF